jgi:hypothetical protein
MATSIWKDLQLTFAEEQLVVPVIPAEFKKNLKKLDDWVWSTRPTEDSLAMYMHSGPIVDFFKGGVDPYFAISHAGHGMNSYALNLALVQDRISVFLQFGFGGAYTARVASRLAIANAFILLERLLGYAEASDDAESVVVTFSNLRGGDAVFVRNDSSGETIDSRFGPIAGWLPYELERQTTRTSFDTTPLNWQDSMPLVDAAKMFIADLASFDIRNITNPDSE